MQGFPVDLQVTTGSSQNLTVQECQVTTGSTQNLTVQECQPVLGIFPGELDVYIHSVYIVCEGLYLLYLDFFTQVVIKVQEIQAFTGPYKHCGLKHQVHQDVNDILMNDTKNKMLPCSSVLVGSDFCMSLIISCLLTRTCLLQPHTSGKSRWKARGGVLQNPCVSTGTQVCENILQFQLLLQNEEICLPSCLFF